MKAVEESGRQVVTLPCRRKLGTSIWIGRVRETCIRRARFLRNSPKSMLCATCGCEPLPHRTRSGSSVADNLGRVAPPCVRSGLEKPRVEPFLPKNSADVRVAAGAKLEPVRSPGITKEGGALVFRGTEGFRGTGGWPSELRRSAILPLALSAEEACGVWVRV